jgi:hypothetical protein
MTPKDYAIELLAQGIPTGQVAAACGVDDSYISQLKADPDVQSKIATLRANHAVEDTQFDNTLERAEALALEKIEKNLPFANMGQALAAFRILNGARRRKDAFAQPDHAVSINVNLTLPATAIPNYVTSRSGEIIEVDGQPMITANQKSLDSILAARAEGKLLTKTSELEKAAARLENLKVPAVKPVQKITTADL